MAENPQGKNGEAIAALPELAREAKLIESYADGKNVAEIGQMHRFQAALQLGDGVYSVRLPVKEFAPGKAYVGRAEVRKLYHHRLEKRMPTGTSERAYIAENPSQPSVGTYTIRELLTGVKDSKGNYFFRPAPEQLRGEVEPGGSQPGGGKASLSLPGEAAKDTRGRTGESGEARGDGGEVTGSANERAAERAASDQAAPPAQPNEIRAKFEAAPKAEVTGEEIYPHNVEMPDTPSGIRKFVLDWLSERGWIKKHSNDDTGWKNINVSRGSVRSVLFHGAGRGKVQALAALPDIIKNGIYLEPTSGPNGSTRHIFAAKLKIGNAPDHVVGFVIHEDKNGRKYYEHELTEIENLGSLGRSPDGEGLTRAGRDSIMDIVRKHLGVNPDMTQSSGNRGPAVRPEPPMKNKAAETEGPEVKSEAAEPQEQTTGNFKALDYGRRVKAAAAKWAKTVDDFFAGRLNKRAIMRLGQTPDLLVEADIGIPALPLVMEQKIGRKITGQDPRYQDPEHCLSPEQVKSLPEKLADPVMVLRSEDRPNNYLIVTDMFIGDAPIMVGIYVDEVQGRIRVNSLTTAFGKNNFGGWLAGEHGQARKGNIAYLNTQKSDSLLNHMSLPQLASVIKQNRSSRKRIVYDTDVIKPVYDEDLRQSRQE